MIIGKPRRLVEAGIASPLDSSKPSQDASVCAWLTPSKVLHQPVPDRTRQRQDSNDKQLAELLTSQMKSKGTPPSVSSIHCCVFGH